MIENINDITMNLNIMMMTHMLYLPIADWTLEEVEPSLNFHTCCPQPEEDYSQTSSGH